MAPQFIIIAGPNEAGKSTAAPALLRDVLDVDNYVNADTIAAGLSAFAPETVALRAGRLMLERMHELARDRQDFAIETTLASRTFAGWAQRLAQDGYRTRLLFLALPDPEIARQRVALRVADGGHDIPAHVIHRRFHRGIRNFFRFYRPAVQRWRVYRTDRPDRPQLIAQGEGRQTHRVLHTSHWRHFEQQGQTP